MIMVRKNELACRDEWSHDLWEARTGAGDAAPVPFVVPFPSGPLKPATETEIAALLRAEMGQAPPPTDVLLSEIGGASFTASTSDPQLGSDPTLNGGVQHSAPREVAVGPEPFARDALRRAHEAFREQTRATGRPERPDDSDRRPTVLPVAPNAETPTLPAAPPVSNEYLPATELAAVAAATDSPESAPSSTYSPASTARDGDTHWSDAPPELGHSEADDAQEWDEDLEIGMGDVVAYDDSLDASRELSPSRGFRFSDLLQWRPGHHAREVSRSPIEPPVDNGTFRAALASQADASRDVMPASDSEASRAARVTGHRHAHTGVHDSGSVDVVPNVLGSAEAERTLADEGSAPEQGKVSLRGPAANPASDADLPLGQLGAATADDELEPMYDRLEVAGDPAFAVPDWFPPEEDAAVAEEDSSQADVLAAPPFVDDADDEAMLPARAAAGPRLCRACRDFRPAEDGDRGWCANPWAFDHRQMVEASDTAPCAGAFGDWWLPKDVIWLDAGDISGHGLATPLLDAFVPSHRPEEPVRRRR